MVDYSLDVKDIDFNQLINGNFYTPDQILAEVNAGELAKAWKIRGLADAYKERPPLRFLVDSLLPCPSLSVVYGSPGGLKSMLLADMAVCVASGKRWLEALPGGKVDPGHTFATTQAPVLWADFDNGRRRTDERIEAFARPRELAIDTPLHYVSMPTPWLDASNRAMTDELGKLIKHLGAKLVIIDNLGLISGDVEENSAAMAQVMGNLRALCDETESAVIVVHHQRKSAGQNDNGIRKGETLRGHSSIEASLDLALLVERKDGEDNIAVIPTKVRGYKPFDIFGGYFTYTHREGTTDLATARFFSRATESAQNKETRIIKDAIRDRIELVDRAIKQGDLVDAVRDALAVKLGSTPGINKVRGILSEMAQDGELNEFSREKGKSNRALFYDLPEKRRVIDDDE